ncbi:hypothetical protein Bca4012_087266 [Brassica carinata]
MAVDLSYAPPRLKQTYCLFNWFPSHFQVIEVEKEAARELSEPQAEIKALKLPERQTEKAVEERVMGYIGAHGAAALHRYKYSGEDHSYLAKYLLDPFWTHFVKVFPLWMPHFLFTCLSQIYSPQLDSPTPRWVHFAHGSLLFLYQVCVSLSLSFECVLTPFLFLKPFELFLDI